MSINNAQFIALPAVLSYYKVEYQDRQKMFHQIHNKQR